MGPTLISDVIPGARGSQQPELLFNLFFDEHNVFCDLFQTQLPAQGRTARNQSVQIPPAPNLLIAIPFLFLQKPPTRVPKGTPVESGISEKSFCLR